jgi:hypothetical protein
MRYVECARPCSWFCAARESIFQFHKILINAFFLFKKAAHLSKNFKQSDYEMFIKNFQFISHNK